jgi:hypothetical protein
MDQNAIEEALTNYTESDLGVDLSEKDVSIKLIAGRGDNGLRAEVSIVTRDELIAEEESENEPELPEVPEAADESEDEEPAIGPFD